MASSRLVMGCANTFSFPKAVEVETRLRWLTEAHSSVVLYHHHLKSKRLQLINTQACSILVIGRNNTRAAARLVCHKMEKQQRRDNAVRENKVEVGGEQVPPISVEKLHEWMTYSVSELGWCHKEMEGSPVPDGIILVEQLNVDEDNYNGIKDETPNMKNCSSSTETWGVVIQGRGADSASYILKTCRDVGSLLGFCTHFCLVKAECFGEIADLQLKNSWLLSQIHN
ncbi:hypothetical protein MKX01_032696 [Papaver californicum]|nr:hypothetical protein MKX01_032696 [Papaver californicum]